MADDYGLCDPSSASSWQFDWTSYYLAEGDSVKAHSWSISPCDGLVLAGEDQEVCTVLSGLTIGNVYRLTDCATFASRQTGERSVGPALR